MTNLTSGYTCGGCGMWVAPGEAHTCYPTHIMALHQFTLKDVVELLREIRDLLKAKEEK